MKSFLWMAALLFSAASVAAQEGVVALMLGPSAAHAPRTNADWDKGLVLDHFVRSNSVSAPDAPTTATLLWDSFALYVRFDCVDPGATFADGSRPKRSDQVEVGFAKSGAVADELWLITVDRDGKSAVRHAGKVEAFSGAVVRTGPQSWQADVAVPWVAVGGAPAGPLRMQISRVRALTGEISSVSAFDYHDGPTDPEHLLAAPTHPLPSTDDFMEVTLGGPRGVVRAPFGLVTLPSGKMMWQPRVVAAPLSSTDRQALEMFTVEEPTTKANVADRVRHADLWYDLVVQEGFSFLQQGNMDAAEARKEVPPWLARTSFNKAIRAGDDVGAFKIVDALLKYMQRVSRGWYVTGVPGDFEHAIWNPLFTTGVEAVEPEANSGPTKLVIHAGMRAISQDLVVSFPRGGGVRLRAAMAGQFDASDVVPMQVKQTAHGMSATANGLIVTVNTSDAKTISISLAGGAKPLWEAELGVRMSADGKVDGYELLGPLAPNEQITGLGERFDSLNQRGKVVTLWQQDAWDSTVIGGLSNDAYKPIPLWHSSAGYSVFWDTRYQVRADFGAEDPGRYEVSSHGPALDLYIWPGTPSETLPMYTALTGKPLLPPVWAFEHWAGGGYRRWASEPGKSGTQAVFDAVKGFQDRDIPLSAVYAEGVARAEPEVYAKLKPTGVRVLSWGRSQLLGADLNHMKAELPTSFNPPPYMMAADGKPFGLLPNGKYDHNFPYLDFTDPHGVDLLRSYWKPYLDLGVAGTMVDFGDMVPRQARFADGSRGEMMHNGYAYGYQRAENQIFHEARGDDFILFARGGSPGTEAFAGQMAGDHTADFRGLQESLHGGMSASLSGFSNWGSDIGGLRGMADEEAYIRYVEFGAFSPLMRDHGMMPREPWYYGDAAVAAYKKYAWLRENLLPYIYGTAQEASATGLAMMRPILSAAVPNATDEYMFGDDLLVAPVVVPGDRRTVTLPAGEWTEFWTGLSVKVAAQKVSVQQVIAPLDFTPVYLRAGALLPVELAADLKLGESMTPGRVAVLIVTPSGAAATSHEWKLPGRSDVTRLESHRTTDGFEVSITNWDGVRDVVAMGLARGVKRISVDGKTLTKSAWMVQIGRVTVPLSSGGPHTVRFITK